MGVFKLNRALRKSLLGTLIAALLLPNFAAASDAPVDDKRHYIFNADPRCPSRGFEQWQAQRFHGVAPTPLAPAPMHAPAIPHRPAMPPPPAPTVAPTVAQARMSESAVTVPSADASRASSKSAPAAPALAHVFVPQGMPMSTQAPGPDAARKGVRTDVRDANPIRRVATEPISTFSVDVDTGSYSSVRGLLNKGQSVPAGAVRAEEFINYFDYAYPRPEQQGSNAPFAVSTEVAPSPWNANNHLLRIGIQARDPAKDSLPPANLVLLIDVSGSMYIPESLPLVQDALLGLVQQLRPQDRVSIVTYAAGTQVVLPPTAGNQKIRLADTLCALRAGGSTAGASGIRLAYEQAKAGFIPRGINRILLATDGDFNVGVADAKQLKDMVAAERKHGIGLSTLGVGNVQYHEHLMEQVADAGDGKYSFLDTLQEGRKVLVNEFTSTLHTIAQDVKLQVEFNPSVVQEYRLIGYENRVLAREDFANDAVDAGDIGAGHRVTALYEITLVGKPGVFATERYERNRPAAAPDKSLAELAHVAIRYKNPSDNPLAQKSIELSHPVPASAVLPRLEAASPDFKFAAAVAGFAQWLARSKHIGGFDAPQALALAQQNLSLDSFGLRRGFLDVVRTAAVSANVHAAAR